MSRSKLTLPQQSSKFPASNLRSRNMEALHRNQLSSVLWAIVLDSFINLDKIHFLFNTHLTNTRSPETPVVALDVSQTTFFFVAIWICAATFVI
jgi:hypothetical protein